MTKYVEAEKLIEWVQEKTHYIRRMTPNLQDKFRGIFSGLEALVEDAIQFDADGWCWDMEKCPRSDENPIDLLFSNGYKGKMHKYYRELDCIPAEKDETYDYFEWFSLKVDDYVGGGKDQAVAWRLIPETPK